MPWWQRYVAILLTMTLYTSVVHHDHGRGAVLKLETATADLRLQLSIPADGADRLVQLLGAIGSRCHAALRIVARLGRTTHVYLTRIVLDPDHEGINASIIFAHRAAEIIVPSHPADAVALALRTQTPIYATDNALAEAWPIASQHLSRAQEALAHWLERVRPGDFTAPPSIGP